MKYGKVILFMLFLLTADALRAQYPKPYIIPDIGAPGMNIYAEVIGRPTEKSFFGPDRIYLDESQGLRIRPSDPSQEGYLVFSPLAVTWNGRLISMHVFVNPSLNPPSWDWNVNGSNWSVNLVVERFQGTDWVEVTSFEFRIVQPQKLGDISAINETVLGQASLGRRSPRGAMIVDSLILGAKTYTVSTADCDPAVAGNQSYLPFILLSKGPIRGQSADNTIISVNGSTKNGGPGGGGGGGSFVDAGFLDQNVHGNDGGLGFTGGGHGGRNGSGVTSNEHEDVGTGSGPDGKSLNGVLPSTTPNIYEAAGGGTGHPFGTSGDQSNNNNQSSHNAKGGYGGGGGSYSNQRGGGGGFATDGGGTNVFGRTVGNAVLVPIAGGSGGASGNPQGSGLTGERSGDGGGGGGAVKIHSDIEVSGLKVTANGSNGEANAPNGGAGSGGGIMASARYGIRQVNLEARGGDVGQASSQGGAGRVRYDYRTLQGFSALPANSSRATGFTSDTTRIVDSRNFNITGSKTATSTLRLYLRTQDGPWAEIASLPSSGTGVQPWTLPVDLTAFPDDKVFYVAGVEFSSKTVDDYLYIPEHLMSQACGNIILLQTADLEAETLVEDTVLNCAGNILRDSVVIRSTGEEDLEIDILNKWADGNKGIKLSTDNTFGTATVVPGSSVTVRWEYETNGSETTGWIRDTLILDNNTGGKNPLRVAVGVYVQDISGVFLDALVPLPIDTLYLGEVCLGNGTTDSARFVNTSGIPITISDIEIENNARVRIDSYAPSALAAAAPGDTATIVVSYFDDGTPGLPDSLYTKLFLYTPDCPEPADSLMVWVRIMKTELVQVPPLLDFGNVKVGTTKKLDVIYRNTGNVATRIHAGDFDNLMEGFFYIASVPDISSGYMLEPGEEVIVTIEFTPLLESGYSSHNIGTATGNSGNNPECPVSYDISMTGNGVDSKLEFPNDTLDFGIRHFCDIDSIITFNIGNDVSAASGVTLTEAARIEGKDADHFEILAQPVPGTVLLPGESVPYAIAFRKVPGVSAGEKFADIIITNDDGAFPDLTLHLKGTVDTLDISYDKDVSGLIDLGNIPIGMDTPFNITMFNNGLLEQTVINTEAPAGTTVVPASFSIVPGGSQGMDIIFNITAEGLYQSEVVFEFEDCGYSDTLRFIAVGVEPELTIDPQSIDFGIRDRCAVLTREITLTNTGTFDLVIDSVRIRPLTGTGAVRFSLLNMVEDSLLSPGESVTVMVEYDGDGAAVGEYEADVLIYDTELGNSIISTIRVRVDVRSGVIITPVTTDFGDVISGSPEQLAFRISKDPDTDWDSDVSISSIAQKLPQVFIIDPAMDNRTFRIDDATSVDVGVTFAPPSAGTYFDSLWIPAVSDASCPDTLWTYFRGRGLDAASIRVWVPDTIADPNIDKFYLPVYAVAEDPKTALKNIGFRKIRLRLNKTMFFPRDLTDNDQFLDRYTDGEYLAMTIATNGADIDTVPSIVAMIKGSTLLGNSAKTDMILDSVEVFQTDKVSRITVNNGSLDLKICTADGERLIDYVKPIDLNAYFDKGGLIVKAHVIEAGSHKISLADARGNVYGISEWVQEREKGFDHEFVFDTGGLSSGVYFILLETPARARARQITMVK